MYEEKTIAAVVPAYNEEPFIGEVIADLPEFVDRAYVIDDRSTDGTWAEIQKHAGDDEAESHVPTPDGGVAPATIVPIRHERNRGVGGAIKTGYQRALEDGVDAAVVIAGDGQMEPDIVERVLEPVADGRADYSKGNRLLHRNRDRMPRFRRFGNFLLSLITKIASGYWKLNDPQNGATAISRNALETVDIDALYEDYGFANDLLVRLNVHGMRVAEVPHRPVYKDETSHIKYSTFIPKTSTLLLQRFLWRLKEKYLVRDFHPLAFFYYLGATATATAVVGGFRSLLSDGTGSERSSSAVLFVFGWLLMLFAMVFDMRESEELELLIDDKE